MRKFTPVELAIGVALGGSLVAVAVPAFLHEMHASRFVEPTEGLARLGAAAVAHADAHGQFPESAPLTPSVPPRGTKEVDAPGTWDAPTWKALAFRPSAEGVPHAYSFSFESNGGASASFVAQARGDLDGDGVLSLFEVRGVARAGEPASVTPGLYVESELE